MFPIQTGNLNATYEYVINPPGNQPPTRYQQYQMPYGSQQILQPPHLTLSNPTINPPFFNTIVPHHPQNLTPQFSTTSPEEQVTNEQNDTEEQLANPHPWQSVTKKRLSTSVENIAYIPPISIQNRFGPIASISNDDSNVMPIESNDNTAKFLKPPPIYVYGVTNHNSMVEHISKVAGIEQYYTKTLGVIPILCGINNPLLSFGTCEELWRCVGERKMVATA
ncbi:hypothetical protein FQA39_LY01668 [Lamprigera yunnana]|nr:hypothetical protein FQA39_LY01668 [Lamprigera yunnana]